MDFFTIRTSPIATGPFKGELETRPEFQVRPSQDLMIRGGDFYAIWDETAGLWSTDEYDIPKYEKVMENGIEKKVTEKYLIDALSCTEAEARIIEEMTPFISGEFTVSDIKRANYSELFPSDEESADRWFKCKLIFITLDEKSGAEKKTSTQVLVQAADLRDAVKKLDEGMKGTMADYQIGMVSETPLMDVYPYSAEPNDKPEFDPSKA